MSKNESNDFENWDWKFYKRVGYAAVLLGQEYDDRRFSRLRNFAAAESHGASKFFFDSSGTLIGGFCWAKLDSSRFPYYLSTGFLIRDTEWDEGDSVVITDFVCPYNDPIPIYRLAIEHLLGLGILSFYRYTGERLSRVRRSAHCVGVRE